MVKDMGISQNLFKVFENDPIKYNLSHIKAIVSMHVIKQLREKGWSKGKAKRRLGLNKDKVCALYSGEINDLSLTWLLKVIVKLGSDINVCNDLDSGLIQMKFAKRSKKT